MEDSYYVQKDQAEFECFNCIDGIDTDGIECEYCEGTGMLGEEAICDMCESYPCRCDYEYERMREDW